MRNQLDSGRAPALRQLSAVADAADSAPAAQANTMQAQRVLVTAGAGGIGREIALAFDSAGANVFVLDADTRAMEALERRTSRIQTASCDLSNSADIERAVPAAIDALGGLDVLVNNAGISGQTAPVESFDPTAWELVMRINLTGTFNVTRFGHSPPEEDRLPPPSS